MTRTFEEMCAERDPLYAEMKPVGAFSEALSSDEYAELLSHADAEIAHNRELAYRDAVLLILAVQALRNQGQPYYHDVARGVR